MLQSLFFEIQPTKRPHLLPSVMIIHHFNFLLNLHSGLAVQYAVQTRGQFNSFWEFQSMLLLLLASWMTLLLSLLSFLLDEPEPPTTATVVLCFFCWLSTYIIIIIIRRFMLVYCQQSLFSLRTSVVPRYCNDSDDNLWLYEARTVDYKTAVSFSTESHSMAALYTSTFLPSFLPSLTIIRYPPPPYAGIKYGSTVVV